MSPHEIAQQIRQRLFGLHTSGQAAQICGFVVSKPVYDQLEILHRRDTGKEFDGQLHITHTEGNRFVTYTFWVLVSDDIIKDRRLMPYVMVPYKRDFYREHLLGQESDILDSPRRTAYITKSTQIVETNRISGEVELQFTGGATTLEHVVYEDMNSLLNDLTDRGMSVGQKIEILKKEFSPQHLVNNPPQTEWLGKLTFDEQLHGRCTNISDGRCRPYILNQRPDLQHVGCLFMKEVLTNQLWAVVAVVADGAGTVRECLMPHSEHDNLAEFALVALRYFLPEEVFVFTSGVRGTIRNLQVLQQRSQTENWGNHTAYNDGHLQVASGTGNRTGHAIITTVRDTRDNSYILEIGFAADGDTETWNKLRQRYGIE